MRRLIENSTIPPEIAADILVLLPAKALGRFRCVSPEWRAFISSSSFVEAHLKRMKHLKEICLIHKVTVVNPPIIYISVPSEVPPIRRSIAKHNEEYEILGSDNGLILIGDVHDRFFLRNPLSMESFLIENDIPVIPNGYSEAWVFYGLGYNIESDDYMIMRVARFFDPEGILSEPKLYSRNSNSWINISPFPFNNPPVDNACFVGGLFHWKVYKGHGENEFITFDPNRLTYSDFEAPLFILSSWFLSIIALDESSIGIYACQLGPEDEGGSSYFFEMHILTYESRRRRSWSRVVIFKEEILPNYYKLVPICFKNSKKRILFREEPSGRFKIYDVMTKEFEPLMYMDDQPHIGCSYWYTPSLVKPFRN